MKTRDYPGIFASPLLRMYKKNGTVYFARTPSGQFFYDLVMGRQTATRLSRKWRLRKSEITRLRRLGRRLLRREVSRHA